MDEAFFRAFIDAEYGAIVGAAAAISGDRQSAEDAVQDALIRAWERLERGEPIDSLGAWVTTVALNISRNRIRSRSAEWRARRRLSQPAFGHEAASDDRMDVLRSLLRLPRRQREAIVLHYYLGYSITEISTLMGTREGTVKSLLSRGRSRLRAQLQFAVPVDMEVER